MSDFLRSAEEQLKFNKDKSSVLAELGDHVETKTEFFKSIGYDENASTEKANEAMGNGEIIGQRLNQIHSRKGKMAGLLILGSALANIGLNLIILLADKSDYSIPFAAALFVLLCNLALTYAAIKWKSLWLSAALMIFSCAAAWLSSPYLAYPLCNLIIAHSGSDPTEIYSFSSVMISVCLCALVFLPNVFNVYHCAQMKRLKNTKRQNRIATALRNACLVTGVLIFVLSFPYYAMNNSLCEEQTKIREELMDFAFETVNEYSFEDKDELEEFLKNSIYDFEYTPFYGNPESEETLTSCIYRYYSGNWMIEFYFPSPESFQGYSLPPYSYIASVSYCVFNRSQRYIISLEGQQNKLFSTIGNPRPVMYDIDESIPNSAEGMSAQEIRYNMNNVSLMGISIVRRIDCTEYNYHWQGKDTSNRLFVNSFMFICDDSGTCTYYDLTYDYHTI